MGRIPSGWQVRRNLGLFRERVERGRPDLGLLTVTIAHGVLPQDTYVSLTGRKPTATGDLATYKVVRAGDLVYNKMRMWQGAIGLAQDHGIVSPAYVVLQPIGDLNPRFFEYQFKTAEFIREAGRYSYGIADDQNSLRFSDFKAIYSVFPPLDEQHGIAAFLDQKTSRIDALVSEQRRLVELLQQKRLVAMSQAVTSGMHEHVPKKASGAKWLDPVPVHWDVVPLKSLAAVDNSGSYGADPEEFGSVLPVATTAQIDARGRFRVNDMPLRAFTTQDVRRYKCKAGEILVVKSSGSAENIISGKAGLVQDDTPPFVFSNFLMRLRPRRDRIVPEYLYYLLTSHLTRERVKEMCSTTTYPNLNVGLYLAAKMPCPPLSEQQAIADHVARAISTVDATIAEIEASIRLLAERRSALITAAVVGQVDTTNWRHDASVEAVT